MTWLAKKFPRMIDGVGTLLVGRTRALSDLETYDLGRPGWFVACLCTPLLTPLLDENSAAHLPRGRERIEAAPRVRAER
ncbi:MULTISPECIES: hypothetical protein [unclassified Streptomyces]|uniref:hypothetical protein n=1 Tax=unclassified Streptomyces TaxID=2593676 RepID=UPI003863E661